MEIMVYCYADNNASIGAGIDTAESTELKEYSWLYEGFSESYYELYRDFEDIKKSCGIWLRITKSREYK